MKLKITYKDDSSKTVHISDNCSTEELIAKIEKHEYNPKVAKVVVAQ
jgi:hypothetical protein